METLKTVLLMIEIDLSLIYDDNVSQMTAIPFLYIYSLLYLDTLKSKSFGFNIELMYNKTNKIYIFIPVSVNYKQCH